ncbi:MAG: TlyA family RNA methyltransferase [Phycisphaerae bacterium]
MTQTSPTDGNRFVSRGGDKLNHALEEFAVDVAGLICADLGSHIGGFVDCLLRRGAAKVYSVDTAYGVLAWTLRKHADVVVLERTNAMHVALPEPVDLVTVDVGWTPQARILPHIATLLRPGGFVVSLIKPQYEASAGGRAQGVLSDEISEAVLDRTLSAIRDAGWQITGPTESPIRGHGGNREFLVLLRRSA